MSFTIVSFCGGGMRGLLSVRILQRLAEIRPSILTDTSLFAGTSTGSGIINFLLASHTPEVIANYFLGTERNFFSKPTGTTKREPAYSIDEVAAGIAAVHGNKALREFAQKVLFTAFDVGAKDRAWAPIIYNNFSSSPNAMDSIAQAVTQSSAMPGMLGAWRRGIDGAFVNHDPSIAAIATALYNGVKFEDIVVINIGTGLMPMWIGDDPATWGADQWENGTAGDNAGNHTPPFLINGKPSPVLDAALSGTSTSLTPTLVNMMLGPNRYANLNPTLDWYIPENSTSDKDIAELEGKARTVNLNMARALLEAHWPDTQAKR